MVEIGTSRINKDFDENFLEMKIFRVFAAFALADAAAMGGAMGMGSRNILN